MKSKENVNVKHIGFYVFMFVGLIGILATFFSKTGVYAKTEDNTTETEERFIMDSKGRIGNYARYNGNMELVTTITNNEGDFTGYVQVIMINEDYSKNVMYQTDLVLAAGETKTVSQEVRWTSNSNRISVRITDKKENILLAKKVKVSVLDQKDCLIGILSDSKQEMGYLDNQKVAYLSKEDISSVIAMGVMDVLVIDNFNTGDLEKEQYEAIKEWVELGGTLVLGTGEQVNRTFAMFQDDYLVGKIGDAENGIADVSFQGEEIIDDLIDNIVFHKVEKGLGVISVANKSLGLNKSEWNTKGYEYINAIERQYSTALLERIKNTENDFYGYYYRDDSELRSTDDIPSVKTFAVVLSVYIIIITVAAYLILKKKDRLEWTWGVVPIVGVIFAGVIIVIGSRTSINGTYMNYMKIMEFQEGEKHKAKDKIYIDIASSNNTNYEILVPEGMEVYARTDYYSYYDYEDKSYEDYDIGFKNKDDQKIIEIKNNQSFGKTALVSESLETVEGSYQSDMYYQNAAVSGTFTNQTGVTIKNAILFAEGKIYKLGTVKTGEKVEITDKTPFKTYMYAFGSDYYEIVGVSKNRDEWSLEEARYVDALEQLSYNNMSIVQNGAVFGYIESDEDSVKDIWGIPCYGITLAKCPIDIDYRTDNGDIYVPDVVKVGQVVSGYYSMDDHTTYFDDSDEEFVLEYTLDENESLTGIYFSSLLNPSVENNTVDEYEGESYEGKIEVYNWKTKQYEIIFQADKEGEITDVEDYVGKENVVLFRMNPDNEGNGSIYVPVISLTKEVKKNGKN